jgi:pimeloyl-ACP methyl ester carboxylesterase
MAVKEIYFEENKLSYQISGEGIPVVLLHGFGEDIGIWKEFVAFAQFRFQFILPDLPGSGLSASWRGDGLTKEVLAKIVHQIIAAERLTDCILLGHSMGGYVALAFAELFPEKIRALGLIHSTAYADSPEKIIARKKSIEFIKMHGSRAFFEASIPGLFHQPDFFKNEIDALVEKAAGISPETLIGYYEAMMKRPDRSQAVSSLQQPFALFIGVHDQAVPFEQSLTQTYLAPISHVKIFRNSGHMAMIEEKNNFNQALFDFLSTV